MKIVLAAVAVLSVGTAAAAERAAPIERGLAVALASKNPISIGKALLNDLNAAQAEAGPAASPIDPTGYACYTKAASSLQGFASQSPAGIISTGEAVWLLAQTIQTVAGDTNCQAVCGRVQLLATRVGGLIAGLAVPNVCGAFQALAE